MARGKTVRSIAGLGCQINASARPWARLVLAHGAGAPMDSDFMEHMARLLCDRGLSVIRFEFPYMAARRETGRKRPPDRQPVLLDSWRMLIHALLEEGGPPIAIGGKSMGGRMASLIANDYEAELRALVCLGYPFHPPGKPEKPRTDHLKQLRVPTLIVQGSRDTMGKPEEVACYDLSSSIHMVWLETANHDLKPLKRSGFSTEDYLTRTADDVAAFIRSSVE